MRRLTTVALAGALLCAVHPAGTAAAEDPGYVPGELLVRFKPQLGGERVRALLAAENQEIERHLPLVPGLRQVELPSGSSVEQSAEQLEALPGVLYAEPNFRRESFAIPNDPRFGEQWYLHNTGQAVFGSAGTPGADIDAASAWETQQGSGAIQVAVIDTGIALTHPDLAGNVWSNPGEAVNGVDDDGNGRVDDVNGWDFVDNDNDPSDGPDIDQGHGTHIAGTIGAQGNNGLGVSGVNWRSSLMAVRTPLDVAGEVDAFQYAVNEGAEVVNYSAGSARYSATEQAAIEAAPGVLFVVAAGNEHTNVDADPIYPCVHPSPNLICVTSTGNDDALSAFSNFGPNSVDIGAPGEAILSTFPPGAVSTDLRDRFGDLPLSDRWQTGGKGLRWRLTKRLGRGLSISDSPKGRYKNKSNTWIRSRPIDLSERRACVLDYFTKLRTQRGKDRLIVDVSRNAKRWRHPRSLSGRKRGTRLFPLPRSFDGDDSVYVRFRLKTDGSVRGDGVYIDDVSVGCETSDNTYAYLDGTSFAAPLVSGAAALVLAQKPAPTAVELRARLLGGADADPSLAGRVSSGGRLNLARALSP